METAVVGGGGRGGAGDPLASGSRVGTGQERAKMMPKCGTPIPDNRRQRTLVHVFEHINRKRSRQCLHTPTLLAHTHQQPTFPGAKHGTKEHICLRAGEATRRQEKNRQTTTRRYDNDSNNNNNNNNNNINNNNNNNNNNNKNNNNNNNGSTLQRLTPSGTSTQYSTPPSLAQQVASPFPGEVW